METKLSMVQQPMVTGHLIKEVTVTSEKQMTFLQFLHELQRKIKHLNSRMLIHEEIVNSQSIKKEIERVANKPKESKEGWYSFKIAHHGLSWR